MRSPAFRPEPPLDLVLHGRPPLQGATCPRRGRAIVPQRPRALGPPVYAASFGARFDRSATIRVCQPRPVAFHRARVSGGSRRETGIGWWPRRRSRPGLRQRLRTARKYEGRNTLPVEEVEAWIAEEAADQGVTWLLE